MCAPPLLLPQHVELELEEYPPELEEEYELFVEIS
tara:strand:+ start:405 stop:509 length:105 start_codon:yes stop_codon:yes gene_type:complete